MRKRHKSFIAGMFILVIIPLAMGVCCCIDDVFASISPAPQHHEHVHQHQHEHQHAAERGQKSGDHDHGDCEHDQLIANGPSSVFVSNHLPISLSLFKNYISRSVSLVQADSRVDFIDTGPPGRLSSLPLYLEISNLRI